MGNLAVITLSIVLILALTHRAAPLSSGSGAQRGEVVFARLLTCMCLTCMCHISVIGPMRLQSSHLASMCRFARARDSPGTKRGAQPALAATGRGAQPECLPTPLVLVPLPCLDLAIPFLRMLSSKICLCLYVVHSGHGDARDADTHLL